MVHYPFVGRVVGCCEYDSGAIVGIVIVFPGDWRFMFWYRDHIFAISRKPGKQQKSADDVTLELAKKHHCSFIELDKVGFSSWGERRGCGTPSNPKYHTNMTRLWRHRRCLLWKHIFHLKELPWRC